MEINLMSYYVNEKKLAFYNFWQKNYKPFVLKTASILVCVIKFKIKLGIQIIFTLHPPLSSISVLFQFSTGIFTWFTTTGNLINPIPASAV